MELNLSRVLDILIAQLFPGPPTAAQSGEAADSATGRRAPVAALVCQVMPGRQVRNLKLTW